MQQERTDPVSQQLLFFMPAAGGLWQKPELGTWLGVSWKIKASQRPGMWRKHPYLAAKRAAAADASGTFFFPITDSGPRLSSPKAEPHGSPGNPHFGVNKATLNSLRAGGGRQALPRQGRKTGTETAYPCGGFNAAASVGKATGSPG